MTFTLKRCLVPAGFCLLLFLVVLGCGESSKLAVNCDEFLAKGDTEQSDIARSFASKSLYGDDDPDADAAIPGVEGNRDGLVEYCSDSEHGDIKLTELETEMTFRP